MISLIALSLSLLVILGGLYLLSKSKKDTLGNLYIFSSYSTIVLGGLFFVGSVIGGVCMMRCHPGHGGQGIHAGHYGGKCASQCGPASSCHYQGHMAKGHCGQKAMHGQCGAMAGNACMHGNEKCSKAHCNKTKCERGMKKRKMIEKEVEVVEEDTEAESSEE